MSNRDDTNPGLDDLRRAAELAERARWPDAVAPAPSQDENRGPTAPGEQPPVGEPADGQRPEDAAEAHARDLAELARHAEHDRRVAEGLDDAAPHTGPA